MQEREEAYVPTVAAARDVIDRRSVGLGDAGLPSFIEGESASLSAFVAVVDERYMLLQPVGNDFIGRFRAEEATAVGADDNVLLTVPSGVGGWRTLTGSR